MNNKENRISMSRQYVAGTVEGMAGEFHEVLHGLANNPASSSVAHRRGEIHPASHAAVDDRKRCGERFRRPASDAALIKNLPTAGNESGDGFGHTCD
jgi:hypothetical protein